MERRNWPWRRKAADRSTHSGEILPSHTALNFNAQAVIDDGMLPAEGNFVNGERGRDPYGVLGDVGDGNGLAALTMDHSVDVPAADDDANHRDKLLAAAEDMVKQHAKLAEDAVAGWEKARSECTSIKQQLERVSEQKRASDAMVSRLEASLRESVVELRRVRAQQEQMILDAVAKTRAEMTAAAAERLAAQKQKAAAAVAAKGKENMSLRQEAMAMRQERDMYKRAADAATRQHLDDIRKMSKLEAECRKLRGAAAGGGGKMDGFDSPRSVRSETFASERLLSERRLRAMEEETKLLKKRLAMANKEILHLSSSAQSSCQTQPPVPAVLASEEDDDVDFDDRQSLAESWCSVLTTSDLSQFLQKEKVGTTAHSNQRRRSAAKALECVESTDDFIEMERLVSMSTTEEQLQEDAGSTAAEDLEHRDLVEPGAECRSVGRIRLTTTNGTEEGSSSSPQRRSTEILADANGSGGDGEQPDLSLEKVVQSAKEAVAVTHHSQGKASEELAAAVRKLVRLLSGGRGGGGEECHDSENPADRSQEGATETINAERLAIAGEQFLHGEMELAEFIAAISSSLLDRMAGLAVVAKGRLSNGGISDRLPSSPAQPPPPLPPPGDEIRKLRAEKAAMESHMRAEFSRIAAVEQALEEARRETSEAQEALRRETESLEADKTGLRVKLAAAEMRVAELSAQLAAATEAKAELVLQLKRSVEEVGRQAEKGMALQDRIEREEERNRRLQMEVEELLQERESRLTPPPSCPSCSSTLPADDHAGAAGKVDDKVEEKQQMADAALKLDECQQTMLALERQLKEMASGRVAVEGREKGGKGGEEDAMEEEDVAEEGAMKKKKKKKEQGGAGEMEMEMEKGGDGERGSGRAAMEEGKVMRTTKQQQQQNKNLFIFSTSHLARSWNLAPPSSSASPPSKRMSGIGRLLSWQKKKSPP